MDTVTTFYTKQNFLSCKNVFCKYLSNTYGLSASQIESMRIDDALYGAMKDAKGSYDVNSKPTLEMNNIVLNMVRTTITEKYKLVRNKENSLKNLERDQSVYGSRQLPELMSLQQSTTSISAEKQAITAQFEVMMNERSGGTKTSQPIAIQQATKDEPLSESELNARLKQFEQKNGNDEYFAASVLIREDAPVSDPKTFYDNLSLIAENDAKDKDMTQNILDGLESSTALPPVDRLTVRQHDIIKKIPIKSNVVKYVTVSSSDRNVLSDPNRCSYSVNVSESYRFRNIVRIEFTKLIIPADSFGSSAGRAFIRAGSSASTEFNVSVPYIILDVDPINDVYVNRGGGTTLFVYDNCHRSSNGRGYIRFIPMQNEAKIYKPTPLSQLPQLTIRLKKPSGALLNNTMDRYSIIQLQYELWNKFYLKVIVNKFFSLNEFAVGDTIVVQNLAVQNTIENYSQLVDFINRPEGHEIVQSGEANTQGYYKYFYIYAPGSLDQDTGTIQLDADMIALIQNISGSNQQPNTGDCDCDDDLTEPTDPDPVVPDPSAPVVVPGQIVNQSLQNTISFTVTMEEQDSDVLAYTNV